MSSLEAQLLRIIEEQQQQLKQQQQQQEKALQQLEEQQKALGLQEKALQQLEDYTAILLKKSEEEVQIVKRYQEMVKKLSEQTVSEHFSQVLQNELATILKTHVTNLVSSLDVKEESRSLLMEILPSWVETEIETQLKPLTEQLSSRLDSVGSYQEKLADLIQEISSRL